MLGFSSYPVANLMTKETECVLEHSTPRANVPRELSKEVRPAHYLHPGDELLVEVLDLESDVRLPADQQIMADGSIDLGKYGRVVVAGKTPEQAEALVQQTVAKIDSESVAINVRLIQPIHRYYVVGEVNSPGAYPLAGHETVLDAILEAGGLTPRASACDMLLARPTDPYSCRVTLPVCYRAITQLGDTTTNYHLQPGDRIFVARQSCWEEMMSCCTGDKTCDRCCARQVACADARVASSNVPEFIRPAFEWILPETPPEPSELKEEGPINEARRPPVISELPPHDQPAVLVPSRLAVPEVDIEPAVTVALDGVLEFDDTNGSR